MADATSTSTQEAAQEALHLVTLPPAFGMRNISPFCLKIEMLLNDLQLDFTVGEEGNPSNTPKGKLPYMNIGGRSLADSELIGSYLDERTNGAVFAGLTDAQKGHGWAATRLAEDHLYWLMVGSRWLDDKWWPNVVGGFFGIFPAIIRPVATYFARKEVTKTLYLQGLGRHSHEEQEGFAHRDFAALQGCVSAEGFLCGATPNYFDYSVAAVLAGIYDNEPATWLTTLAMDYPDLREYTDRVQSHVGVFGRYV